MGAVGLCTVHINGKKIGTSTGANWSGTKAVAQHFTQQQVEQANGTPVATVSINKIIAEDGSPAELDYKALVKCAIEIRSEATERTVFLGEQCDWNNIGGNAERQSASTTGTMQFMCAKPVVF